MRILFVSHAFPPYSSMGAVRVGKTAKYLSRAGHDVRVLTAADQYLPATLPLEVPQEHVIYTRWLNVNAPNRLFWGSRQRFEASGYEGAKATVRQRLAWFLRLYKTLVHFPDAEIGWLPFALSAGKRLVRDWKPDIIYASGTPYTSLIAASLLAASSGISWVGELRDLWTENPYHDYCASRRIIEKALERRVLSSAKGLVVTSEFSAQALRTNYAAPVVTVLNGFDPADYVRQPHISPRPDELRIVYTGIIYEGRRDPSPLFQAISILGDAGRCVKVEFYGRYLETVRRSAKRYGIANQVLIHDQVPHLDALRVQSTADILLLLLWDDPRDRGVVPGKLFEYIGARRPVLAIGPVENVAASLILDRQVGIALTDPSKIARALKAWIAQKAMRGEIAPIPCAATAGLTREEQAAQIGGFLQKVVGDAASVSADEQILRRRGTNMRSAHSRSEACASESDSCGAYR